MTKNNLLYVLMICYLTACSPAQRNDIQYQDFSCIQEQNVCQVKSAVGEFYIGFNLNEIITETPFEIALDYKGTHKLINISGYLEGVDMFMGKIPLFFQKSENNSFRFIAETQLGSCSQEHMQWQAWFNVEYLDHSGQQQQQTFSMRFTSQRM